MSQKYMPIWCTKFDSNRPIISSNINISRIVNTKEKKLEMNKMGHFFFGLGSR